MTSRPSCYILGSGSSLNLLTQAERRYLNEHPRVLALNKYLLFEDIIGVSPSDYMLLDRHFPAHIVFSRTLQTLSKLARKPTLYIEEFYRKYVSLKPTELLDGLKSRIFLWHKTKFWLPLNIIGTKINFCHNILDNDQTFRWAKTIDEPLYFYRGSLTSALNLATIIYPGCDIKLLGVDLNTNNYFFDDRLMRHPELIDRFYTVGQQDNKHPTTIDIGKSSKHTSILNSFPKILKQLEHLGVQVYACNPDSLLVTQQICDSCSVKD